MFSGPSRTHTNQAGVSLQGAPSPNKNAPVAHCMLTIWCKLIGICPWCHFYQLELEQENNIHKRCLAKVRKSNIEKSSWFCTYMKFIFFVAVDPLNIFVLIMSISWIQILYFVVQIRPLIFNFDIIVFSSTLHKNYENFWFVNKNCI